MLVDCAHDDPRLHGTWHSNRDATVAAAFQRDPRWTNSPPERVERFRDIFGHMTITYSNGVQTADYKGEVESFRYRVVDRGADYVVIRSGATRTRGETFGFDLLTRTKAIGLIPDLWGAVWRRGLIESRNDDRDGGGITKPASCQAGTRVMLGALAWCWRFLWRRAVLAKALGTRRAQNSDDSSSPTR